MNSLPIVSVILTFSNIIITRVAIYLTNRRFNRTMLDNLDSKSGWRKTLYEIAGEHNITLNNVQQLRSSLRYKEKEDKPTLSSFDSVNIIIIKYCNQLIRKKQFYKGKVTFNFYESESIRIFCRYLLKDHWEKNHSQHHIYEDKSEELELCKYTLIEFLKLHTSNKDENLENNNLNELFTKANKLFDNNKNDDETPKN